MDMPISNGIPGLKVYSWLEICLWWQYYRVGDVFMKYIRTYNRHRKDPYVFKLPENRFKLAAPINDNSVPADYCIYQQENAPSHTGRIVRYWNEEHSREF